MKFSRTAVTVFMAFFATLPVLASPTAIEVGSGELDSHQEVTLRLSSDWLELI